jgi:four helix bundle protein
MVRHYRDLVVWQRSMDLAVQSFRLASAFPASETYGLASQVRRAAASIPANIAEGHGREHLGDYLRHLSIANGSLMELETHVLLAGRLGYVSTADVDGILRQSSESGRMLAGLTRALRTKNRRGRLQGAKTEPPAPDTRPLTPDT